MYKVIEPLSYRNYCLVDGEPIEMCVEGYRLENGIEIMYIGGKWLDFNENEYTAVTMREVVGFNRKNTLTEIDKQILSSSSEGRAYVEYNERIGGDDLGLNVPWGYPSRVQDYLDLGHTIEEIYKECIQRGISWEEMFCCYIDSTPEIVDCFVVELCK